MFSGIFIWKILYQLVMSIYQNYVNLLLYNKTVSKMEADSFV